MHHVCNCIYIYIYRCGLQYVGQTNNLRLRINGHRSDMKKYANGCRSKTEYNLLYSHLNQHNSDNFSVQILENLKSAGLKSDNMHQLLNEKEKQWLWKLDTIRPHGLNIDDGFHPQNKKSRK